MKDLAKRNIDLHTYLIAMGANTLKYQPQVMEDPDPLVDIDNISYDEDSENEGSQSENDRFGDPIEDVLF